MGGQDGARRRVRRVHRREERREPRRPAGALAEAAAAGRLDRDEVAGAQLLRHLRGLLLAVHERAPAGAVLAPVLAARRVRAALGEHGDTAILEHAELAHDTVPTTVLAAAAGTGAQVPALDAQGIGELERL